MVLGGLTCRMAETINLIKSYQKVEDSVSPNDIYTMAVFEKVSSTKRITNRQKLPSSLLVLQARIRWRV